MQGCQTYTAKEILNRKEVANMKCVEVHNNILGFIEGGLESSLHEGIAKHVESCESCAACEKKIREAMGLIEQEKQTSFDRKMFADIQIAMAESAETDASLRQHPSKYLLRALPYAALLVLAVFAGVHIGKEYAFEKSLASDYQNELFYLNGIHMESQVIIPLSEPNTEP